MQTLNETSHLITFPGIVTDEWVREQWALQGWTTTVSKTGWYTRIRDGELQHVGVRNLAKGDPLIGKQFDDVEATYNIDSWQALTGVWYRHTPGLAATMHMLPHVIGRARLRCYNSNTATWWTPPAPINDLKWAAPRGPGRYAGKTHRYDMRSAYLASAAAVTLPAKQLEHTGSDPADGSVGYYRVYAHWPANMSRQLVSMLGPADRQGCRWVCHPTLGWLRSVVPVTVHDSYTQPIGKRLLRGWAESWRDLLATPDLWHVFAEVLKRGYAEAFGLMNVPRGTIYRPDWRHMIIDHTRASLLRRIHTTCRANPNLTPTRIDVDSLWYPTGYLGPTELGELLGVGDRIGNMRYEGYQE